MTADDVLEIVGLLRASDVDVWLLGGWGVDALVGEQTRDHKDLDLIVRDDDVARASDVLNERGFRMERGAEGASFFATGSTAWSISTRFDSTIAVTAVSRMRTVGRSNIQPSPSPRGGTSPVAAWPACLPKRR
jgi:uncharacterized protein YaaQ